MSVGIAVVLVVWVLLSSLVLPLTALWVAMLTEKYTRRVRVLAVGTVLAVWAIVFGGGLTVIGEQLEWTSEYECVEMPGAVDC